MFSKIFIERPRFAIVISLVMVLAGVISLYKLPVAEYPEIAPPTITVEASYPGASADVVVQTVSSPIEDEINGVDDLLYYSSSSDNDGNYSCEVTFKTGTDTDIAMVNLQNAVKRAETKLPADVKKYGINVSKRGSDMLAIFAFMTDGRTMDIMELNNYVDSNVKDAVARLDGVSNAQIMSLQEYSMRIWLDPIRMAGLAISTTDIMNAVESQNIQAAAGSIGSENSNQFVNYKLNVTGRLKTAAEFEDIILRHDADGSIVRLGDVAKVEIGASVYAGHCVYNGQEVVGMFVNRAPEANAIGTVNRVKAELEVWEKRFPPGVSYAVAYDPTEFINVTLNEIITTLMLNYVAMNWLNYFVFGPWRDPSSLGFPMTAVFPDSARLPFLWGTRIHTGLFLALLLPFLFWAILKYTRWGYEIRVMGENPKAANFAGMSYLKNVVFVMFLSGAIAGIAGMGELAGLQGRLQHGFSGGIL